MDREDIICKYKKYFLFYITLFLLLQIPLLALKPPIYREGLISDVAYHLNSQLNGNMAKDIQGGNTWSSNFGKSLIFVHSLLYKMFGVGLLQARLVTLISGILILCLVYKWSAEYISSDVAILSTVLMMASFSFWPFIPFNGQHMSHSMFAFLSFYLLYSAVSHKKSIFYILAGFFSALSVENSIRGSEIVLIVYLVHLFLFDKKTFIKNSFLMLAGSFIAFMFWVLFNILPMGFSDFFQYRFASAAGVAEHNISLMSEIYRFINYFKSQGGAVKIEIAYWVALLIIFFKYKLRIKFPLVSKLIFLWLATVFIVMSFIEHRSATSYFLMYGPFICIICGMGLHELFLRKRNVAWMLIFFIMFTGMGYQVGRVLIYSYHQYIKTGYGMEGYFEKLRLNVDLGKNILGQPEYWYAFPDTQFYGGNYYLSRVISVLNELKVADEYEDKNIKALDMLNVLKKRKIVYMVLDYDSRDWFAEYFPNHKLPEKNFKLINKIKNQFLNCSSQPRGPHCNVETYQVISYD